METFPILVDKILRYPILNSTAPDYTGFLGGVICFASIMALTIYLLSRDDLARFSKRVFASILAMTILSGGVSWSAASANDRAIAQAYASLRSEPYCGSVLEALRSGTEVLDSGKYYRVMHRCGAQPGLIPHRAGQS